MVTRNLSSFASGALFGFGLCLSRMVDPAVVVGFADVTGAWDPRLMLVMAGALLVTVPGFRWVLGRMRRPLCDECFHMPDKTAVDLPLVMGAALFGVGWGLGGVCPGPAVTGLVFERVEAWIFLASMLAGMGLHSLTRGREG